MKILWHSVLPLISTGYGTQTKLFVRQLKKLGHEVAISCSCGAPMTTMVWEGVRCFPDSGHVNKYGVDMVQTHAERWGADVVWSWLDAFVIPVDVAKKLNNWAAWVPVDSDPLMVKNIKPLEAVRWRIAPTRWGVKMLENAGLKDVMFLPCAHDPMVFYPMSDQPAAKKEFGRVIKKDLTGKFLVNVVSANSGGRKNFQAIFQAWKMFQATHPDALLYLHTDITGYFSGGSDLIEMAKTYGVENESICFVSQWEYDTGQLGDDYLNLLYNASDAHLNCCYGEGFGLPIMDAQAAGCPTVVPNFAAASEVGLCYKVKKGQMYSTVPGALQFMVDPDAVVEQLEMVYSYRDNPDNPEHRHLIHEFTTPWQIDNVVEDNLIPILDRMGKELKL